MELKEYFWLAMRTDAQLTNEQRLRAGVFGMFEEVGELIGVVNKHLYQGQPLNKDKCELEAGDVYWRAMQTFKALDYIPGVNVVMPQSTSSDLEGILTSLIQNVSNISFTASNYLFPGDLSISREALKNSMIYTINNGLLFTLNQFLVLIDSHSDTVMQRNIEKLEKRYEEKLFSTAASIARVDTLQFEAIEDHYRVLPPDPNKVYLNTYDAANLLNVDQLWLHKHLLSTGVLSCSEIDRSSKIPLDELLSWKENRDKNRKVGLEKLTELSEELGLYQDKE